MSGLKNSPGQLASQMQAVASVTGLHDSASACYACSPSAAVCTLPCWGHKLYRKSMAGWVQLLCYLSNGLTTCWLELGFSRYLANS